MPIADQDRYLAEMAVVARALGAEDVPETRAALDAYLAAMRPALRVDHRTREVARALLDRPAPTLALAPFRKLTMEGAIDLLPAGRGDCTASTGRWSSALVCAPGWRRRAG